MASSASRFTPADLARLREAVLDVTAVINSPKPDAAMIAAAGVTLDRALFPLLSRIERAGSMGVKALAEAVGRDYTTVSRQVAKLEASGLVERQPDPADARVNRAVLTKAGRQMTAAIDGVRREQLERLLGHWDAADLHELLRLTRRLADDLGGWGRDGAETG